tara:strand:+ start:12509 stop:13399 length:891 start_codon:yes stop_codon:yes gene_type:complete
MLSILIPTYNHNVFQLVTRLNNELETVEIPYEILVFDDNSSEPLPDNDRIVTYKKTHLKKLSKNIGRSAIRLQLAQAAAYDWILFLDADVMPVASNFIQKYVDACSNTAQEVLFGGISYAEEKPPKKQLLRWEYGRNREVQPVKERQKKPHFVITQNVLIKKETYLSLPIPTENFYGDDLVFSQELKRKNSNVLHIENPVLHLGLESSEKYLKKALSAVKSIVMLEENGTLDNDLTKLQQTYLQLKRYRLLGVFKLYFSAKKKKMEQNLLSSTPNLRWFDLYRLLYYIELKSEKNA